MSQTAAYLRVSSRSQDLATQRSAIEQVAKARGFEIGVWYQEKASARTINWPELARLRADARQGRVQRVLVFRIDRLARSGIKDAFEVVEDLRASGCELVTVADGFSLDGPASEVVLAVMAWAAKMERIAINERISAARERLAAEGRPWGRPSSLTKKDRERIGDLRDQGRSIREIAVALKIPRSTVALALSRNVGRVPPSSNPNLAHPKHGATMKSASGTGGTR